MAKGFEIAEGYIGIEADTAGALKDVRAFFKTVDRQLDAVEDNFENHGKESGKRFADGTAAGFDKSVTRFVRSVTTSVRKTTNRGGGLLGALIPGDGGASGGKGVFSRLLSGAGDFFRSISTGFTAALTSGMQGASSAWASLSTVFQQASNIGGGLGGILQFAAMATIIPVIAGLAGALVHLSAALFALPAAAGVALAIIAPLMIAFKGFGEAVGAGLSGDVDAFNEALKKLTPNARAVAREFVALSPIFKDIKKNVSSAFFAPLIGAIKPLATTLFPALNSGLTLVAGSLGKVAAGFLELLAANDIVEAIGDVFETTARIVDRLGPSLVGLFGSMFGIMEKGLPFVERLFGALADGIDKFSAWLGEIQANGQLEGWLERAWNVGKQLWNVLKGIGELTLTVLSALGDEGTDTLKGMGEALGEIVGWLKTDQGLEFLHNLGVLVHWAGNAMVFLIGTTTALWTTFNYLFDFIRGIGPFFAMVGGWFADLGRSIGDWAVSLWTGITEKGNGALAWLAALPGRVGEFIGGLPQMVADLWNRMFENTAYGIGYLAGLIFVFFMTTLPNLVKEGWNSAWGWFKDGIAKLGASAMELPGRLWSALSGIGALLNGLFRDAMSSALSAFSQGVSNVVGVAKGIPGRLWSAVSGVGAMFYNAGRDAISGLVGGIEDALGWAVNKARDAASAIKRGFLDALEIGSPSRVMAREVGVPIMQGIGKGMERGLPDLSKYVTGVSMGLARAGGDGASAAVPNVTVGSPHVAVMLDGEQIAARIVLKPAKVAAATDEGRRQRGWVYSPRAKR